MRLGRVDPHKICGYPLVRIYLFIQLWKLTEGWLVSCAHFLRKLLDCVLFVLINSIKLNKLDSDIEKNCVFKR